MKVVFLLFVTSAFVYKNRVDACWGSKSKTKERTDPGELFRTNCAPVKSSVEFHNTDIHHILPKTLTVRCERSTENMDLKFRNYTKIAAGPRTFENCHKLANIDLSHNFITEIDNNAFANLSRLGVLRLGFNKLKKLQLEIGRYMLYIYLNDNELEELQLVSELDDDIYLDTINVHNNLLTMIHIADNIHVREVNIQNNRLKTLGFSQQIATKQGPSVCVIRLSCNNLAGISFQPLNFLGGDIYASDTNIESWQVHQLLKNPNHIQNLDLSNNTRLANIDWPAVKGRNNIHNLKLNGVGMSRLDEAKVKNALPQLQKIWLYRNAFTCETLEKLVQGFKIFWIKVSASDCL